MCHDRIPAGIDHRARAQRDRPLPGRHHDGVDTAIGRVDVDEMRVEIDVETGDRRRQLVGETREREGRVGQHEASSATDWLFTPGQRGQPPGELRGEALVEGLRSSAERRQVETADRADHARRRHAAEKAVTLDERGSRTAFRRGDGGGDARGPAAGDDDVIAHDVLVHAIPSATISTIWAASSAATAPSTRDTTMLFTPAHRLKNTPMPGRGSTQGT